MLALFFAWMMAVALLDAVTILPRWLCLLIPTVVGITLLYKKPEWF